MKTTSFFRIFLFLCAACCLLPSCETDFSNPSAISEEQILGSADGLISLAVGVQRRYTVGRQSPVYARTTGAGFSTGELRLLNPGNLSENNLSIGREVLDSDDALVNNLWSQSLLIRNEAKIVLDNLAAVTNTGSRAGLQAYATIFYALANETLYLFFEQAPTETATNAAFRERAALLQDNVNRLSAAADALAGATLPADFLSRIPSGIDLSNTLSALLARHNLLLGNHQAAIDAANDVNRNATSVFQYDGVNQNPIAFVSITTDNVYQPLNLTLGLPAALQPAADDQRLAFYFENLTPDNQAFRAAGFYDANGTSIPIYLPGEMDLIVAEAQARLGNLELSKTALDAVLTKLPSEDPYGVGAGLAAYSGALTAPALLDAIYANRAAEFQLSGLRLEDSRRFNRPGPNDANSERNRNFYPYPNSERDNNPNTPANPPV